MVPLFIEFLPLLVKAAKSVPEVITFIQKTRERFKQDKEWDAAAEEAFNRYKDEITSAPHWKSEDA